MLSKEEIGMMFSENYLYYAMMNGEVGVVADEVLKLMQDAFEEGRQDAIKGIAEG